MNAEDEIRQIERRLRTDYENADTPEFSYAWLAREIYKILLDDRAQRKNS